MTRASCFLAIFGAALPLAAQPKLLTNAKVDTRSAAPGLDSAFHSLLTSQPQPAWIGYTVPSVRTYSLGCDYVNRDGSGQAGVVHLEPPDHAVILYRVEDNAVDRIRALSPDCEIDGGEAPVHWLNDVKPAESVALLATFATSGTPGGSGAISAIAMHADAGADQTLDRLLATDQPQSLRMRVVSWLGSARGRQGFDRLKGLIASDPDERVRERAVAALGSCKEPEAADLLLETATKNTNSRLRMQAVSELGRKPGAKTVTTLAGIIDNDPDLQVRRRALSALQSLPDGAGIPVLIQMVKNAKDAELRKQAMSSLGNSRDPRAVAFFEDVLKK